MSRLLIVTTPELVAGFQLAGVDARPADSAAEAEKIVLGLVAAGEDGLLAVDEDYLAAFSREVRAKLDQARSLPYFPLPGGMPQGSERSSRDRITTLLRQAIGFQISFKGGD